MRRPVAQIGGRGVAELGYHFVAVQHLNLLIRRVPPLEGLAGGRGSIHQRILRRHSASVPDQAGARHGAVAGETRAVIRLALESAYGFVLIDQNGGRFAGVDGDLVGRVTAIVGTNAQGLSILAAVSPHRLRFWWDESHCRPSRPPCR